KVREIDPLYRRVTEIERRLDALEKAKRTSSRRASTRARRSTPRTSSVASALEPERGGAQAGNGPEAGRGGAYAVRGPFRPRCDPRRRRPLAGCGRLRFR